MKLAERLTIPDQFRGVAGIIALTIIHTIVLHSSLDLAVGK